MAGEKLEKALVSIARLIMRFTWGRDTTASCLRSLAPLGDAATAYALPLFMLVKNDSAAVHFSVRAKRLSGKKSRTIVFE